MTEVQFLSLPVKKCFFKLTIPSIISMFFSSIYIIADGVFVGYYIGEKALAAVNIIMPIVMIIFAVSNMIAVGSSVKISIALGEKNIIKARAIFSFSVILILAFSIFFSIISTLLADIIISLLIKDICLADFATKYLYVLVLGLPFIMPLFALDNYLRVCGKAKYSMWINIGVSILNIVMDWFFIAKLGFGITASAIATVISMALGVALSFYPFINKKVTLHFVRPYISKSEFFSLLYNGSSEFLSSIASSFMAIIMNSVLLLFGGTVAVASYGSVLYIDTLLIGTLYAVMDSIQPAISYNLGAHQINRIFSFFTVSCMFTFAISLICMLAIILFPEYLASIFSKKENVNVINTTVTALSLFAPSYLFTWFNMVSSAFLTAMDKPKESVLIMLFRTILFPLICLLLLAPIFKLNGVFFVPTLSSFLSTLLTCFIWKVIISEFSYKSRNNIEVNLS